MMYQLSVVMQFLFLVAAMGILAALARYCILRPDAGPIDFVIAMLSAAGFVVAGTILAIGLACL